MSIVNLQSNTKRKQTRMKKTLIALVCLAFITTSVSAGVIVLDGKYFGKNIYVQNPFASSGVGYCTIEVQVNGQTTTDEINSSAYEIDLSFFQLEMGEDVEIKIKHKDDCKPKVLNDNVLSPGSTFEIDAMKVNKDGTLYVSTKNETGPLPYKVQQFRWNKWVDIGEFEGKGSSGVNKYEFPIATIHSGDNKFRLKQEDASGKPRYSFEAKFKSPLPEVQFTNPGDGKKAKDNISFSEQTMYEIFNG